MVVDDRVNVTYLLLIAALNVQGFGNSIEFALGYNWCTGYRVIKSTITAVIDTLACGSNVL